MRQKRSGHLAAFILHLKILLSWPMRRLLAVICTKNINLTDYLSTRYSKPLPDPGNADRQTNGTEIRLDNLRKKYFLLCEQSLSTHRILVLDLWYIHPSTPFF